MKRQEVDIQLTEQQLTANALTTFVQKATSFASDVRLGKEDKLVDAKSVLGVLTLALKTGDHVVIETEGSDEETAVAALVAYFQA